MLKSPSELASKAFREAPELIYAVGDITRLVAWAACGAYEMDWDQFCRHVLSHLAWCELLEVQDQAGLDHLKGDFSQAQVRLIELAVHDGLKAGDQCDTRPEGQRSKVRDQFANYGPVRVAFQFPA